MIHGTVIAFSLLVFLSLYTLGAGLHEREKERARRLLERPGEKAAEAPFLPDWKHLLERLNLLQGKRRFLVACILFLLLHLLTGSLVPSLALPALFLAGKRIRLGRPLKGKHDAEEEVVEFIDSLGQSLRAGFSLHQALEHSLRDVEGELHGILAPVVEEARMGRDLKGVLRRAGRETTLPSLRLTFTVLGLMHAKGGDLPRILDRLRRRVMDGVEARRETRVLTTQGRVSGYLVAALPLVFLLLQSFISPGSLKVLLTTAAGNIILAAAVLLDAGAFLIIRRLVQ